MELKYIYLVVNIILQSSKALSENGSGMILTTTLASTNRDYACVNETVVVTCSGGIGTELVWHYNGSLPFFFDNNTASIPQAMYNKPARVIAYLTDRTSIGAKFQYTSQLSIERITTADSVEVNCTVTSDPINMTDSVVRTLSVRKSAVPNEVAVRAVDQLGCVGLNENISHHLLNWMPPDNFNDFDLSHYEVTVTSPSTNLTVRCIDTSTIFQLDATNDDVDTVNISIVAINQCGQRGTTAESAGMVQQLRKCQSPVPNSSEVPLKISAILWAASLLIIAMILPAS